MKHFLLAFCLLLTVPALSVRADHVDPLLEGWVRHQRAPFNGQCPYFVDSKGTVSSERCVVGCVATALESILSYYRLPIVLQESLPAWSTDNFTTTDLPAGTAIDTQLILPDYGDGTAASVGMSERDYAESVDAVSRLSLICGMMARMNWGVESSGANVGNLVEPLQQILGWKTAKYIDSYCYTPEQWREIIKNELRNGRPVLYTGYTMNIAGHAFVIDGFDEEGRFHFNWGFEGGYDQYYYDITEMANFSDPYDYTQADVQQGFFCNQQALLLCPEEVVSPLVADSIKRDGHEVVVESVTIDKTPQTATYTPLTITVRNVSGLPLTTPFEIFTNATSDDDIFAEGDYGALFGCTLQPGESKALTIHCKFTKSGHRTLRISPDDETILYNKAVIFHAGESDRITFGAPSMSLVPSTDAMPVANAASSEGMPSLTDPPIAYDATFTFPVTNEREERCGSMLTYCMMPTEEVLTHGDFRHYEYCYIDPLETAMMSVTFKRLCPGSTHNFVIRRPWTIRQQYVFTIPDEPSAIGDVHLMPTDADAYDLSGRRVERPAGGFLIHNGRKIIR